MFAIALHRRTLLAVSLFTLAITGASIPALGTGAPAPATDLRSVDANQSTGSSALDVTVGHGDDGLLVLRPTTNQTVHIDTDASAGSELRVRLRSPEFHILKTTVVTVGADGNATAVFNMSDSNPDETFTVSATYGDGETSEVGGVVVDESATVHRDSTFELSEPTSNYTVRGRVMGYADRLDLNLTVEGTTHSENVAVDDSGQFAASFDLSSVSSGSKAVLDVGGIPRQVNAVVATERSGSLSVYATIETPANATIRYPEETLLVHATSDRTIRGTTNLRPGTELTVTAVRDELNDPTNFERTDDVTVRGDGSFVASLNFTGVEPGTNFSVDVGPGLASLDGRVVNESVAVPTVTTTASGSASSSTTTVSETTDGTTTGGTTTDGTTTDGTANDETAEGHTDELRAPGLGVLAGLLGLLGALALARRRGT